LGIPALLEKAGQAYPPALAVSIHDTLPAANTVQPWNQGRSGL